MTVAIDFVKCISQPSSHNGPNANKDFRSPGITCTFVASLDNIGTFKFAECVLFSVCLFGNITSTASEANLCFCILSSINLSCGEKNVLDAPQSPIIKLKFLCGFVDL